MFDRSYKILYNDFMICFTDLVIRQVQSAALPKEWAALEIMKARNMKTIKYKDKDYKLPFAVAVYDVIMGSEMFQDWKSHRKGLDWFIKYFPKEYGVLLD